MYGGRKAAWQARDCRRLSYFAQDRCSLGAHERYRQRKLALLVLEPTHASQSYVQSCAQQSFVSRTKQWATIITCAGDSDTDVKFWNLSGELLQTVNTNQVANYHCVASKDNRYIAVAAYTPEVKIYEIAREKSGAFRKVNKIMTLQGHRVRQKIEKAEVDRI